MIVGTTALFTRTLRVETRLFRGYGLRALLGIVVLLMLASTQSTAYARNAAGLDLIRIIVWSAFACVTLAGLSSFCSAITEEKEEGTLGLMRMAGLDPVAILLGKSTARLWDALLLGATMLPFATLAVTLGGVSLPQVFACAIALAGYVFLLANLGLLASVVMRTTQGASSFASVILFSVLVLPLFVLLARGNAWAWLTAVARGLDHASIISRLNVVLNTGYSGPIVDAQFWLDLAAGLGGFALAWLAFDRFAHVEAETTPKVLVMRRRSRLNILGLPRPRHGLAALAWKDFHFVCGGRLILAAKLVCACGLIAFILWVQRRTDAAVEQSGEAIVTIGLLWLVFETALLLSRLYANEVRGQTLEGIVTLPYAIPAIAYTKLRSLLPALLPVLVFTAVGAAMAFESVVRTLGELVDRPLAPLGAVVSVLYFWHACAWVSLVVRRGALAAAFGLVLITWWAISILDRVVMTVTGHSGEDGFAWACYAGLLIGCFLMQRGVARRLRRKAAG